MHMCGLYIVHIEKIVTLFAKFPDNVHDRQIKHVVYKLIKLLQVLLTSLVFEN